MAFMILPLISSDVHDIAGKNQYYLGIIISGEGFSFQIETNPIVQLLLIDDLFLPV
jgi:hypothetical protein